VPYCRAVWVQFWKWFTHCHFIEIYGCVCHGKSVNMWVSKELFLLMKADATCGKSAASTVPLSFFVVCSRMLRVMAWEAVEILRYWWASPRYNTTRTNRNHTICALCPVLTSPFTMSFIWLSGSSVHMGAFTPIEAPPLNFGVAFLPVPISQAMPYNQGKYY